jgi:hypothetical protein
MKKTSFPDDRQPEVIDGKSGKVQPPLLKLGDIATARQVRRAIAKIIKAEIDGQLEHFRARGLVWMLRELGAQIYDSELEGRLRVVEDDRRLEAPRMLRVVG